jgi:hypothetical protein
MHAGDQNSEEEDAEEFAEQVLLRQLFFAGVHPHGAAAALEAAVAAGDTSQGASLQNTPVGGVRGNRGTASRPRTALGFGGSLDSEGLAVESGEEDAADVSHRDALHTVMEEQESEHLSEVEDGESQPPGAALVVTLRTVQLPVTPGSYVGIRARASCSTRQLCRVVQYTGDTSSYTGNTALNNQGVAAARHQHPSSAGAPVSAKVPSQPLLRCALPAALPAMPLTAAAATLILEIWSAPGPPDSPPLRYPVPQQGVADAVQGSTSVPPSLVWALDPDMLDESQGCELLGVAVVPLTLPLGSARATADGIFPVKDVLGSTGSTDPVLGTVDVLASLERAVPLVRHTWRVTVCGAAGLPSAEDMEAAGLPAPVGRYAKYYYPGKYGRGHVGTWDIQSLSA